MGVRGTRLLSRFTTQKCFVDEYQIAFHSENIMVKKSRPSGKGETKTPVKEETLAVEKEIPAVYEGTIAAGKAGKGIDFYHILAGGGAVWGAIMVVILILRYLLHMI